MVANSLRKEILDDKMAAEGGGMVMIQQQQPGAYPGEPSPMYPPPQEPMFAQPVGAGGGAGIKNGGFQGDNQEPNDPFAPEY